MPVTGGVSKIQNEDYNGLRTTTSGIYVTDWNQTMRSADVVGGSTPGVSDTVESEQWRDLMLDIQSVHVHQTGSVNTGLNHPSDGFIIAADTSTGYNQGTGARPAVTGGATMGFNDYEDAVTTISNYNPSHLSFPDANFTSSTATSSTRTPSWGIGTATAPTSIYHVVTATFASAAARNYYFNAGGRLAFSASMASIGTGASQSKNQDWADMYTAMGTIRFDKFSTSGDSGTSAGLGMDDLTSSYQLLFTKTGSGNYNDNVYTIEGRAVSTTVVRFRIQFEDGDTGTGNLGGPGTGTPIDEPVTGNVTSNFLSQRPDSTFTYNSTSYTACDLPAPTLANQVLLTANNTSDPS